MSGRIHRSPGPWVAFLVCAALSLASCGQSESSESQPSSFRVAKAVLKNLLSNSVEVEEATPEDTPSPQPAPAEIAAIDYDQASPEIGETCAVPYSGPVTIIPVRTSNALQRSVAEHPSRDLVYETEDTAIFENGRVLTTDLEGVGSHLNAVGWSTNPMKILGSNVRPGGSSRNLGWSSGEGTKKSRRSKKRRRRG